MCFIRSGSRANKHTSRTAPKQDPGTKPPNVHPASLVRLKSPIALRYTSAPPPKVKRKYKSYSDAVSQGSGTSSDEEAGSESSVRVKEEPLSDRDAGSLVDFIDE